MRKFNIASDFGSATLVALSTTNKSILVGVAQTATLRRGRIVEVALGPMSNPANQDTNIIYAIQRCTAPGTGITTGVTPTPVNTQEAGTDLVPGSLWTAQTFTVEPTYTAGQRLWTKALNQHSGFIWYSPDEMGLPWPATNNNGLGAVARGATTDYTGSVMIELKFEE